MEKVEYAGWKNNLRISNGETELIATLDVGPRIISYKLKNGKNVFKEYQDQLGGSGEKSWMIRGGHRFWAGPEDTTRTYALDNSPISFKEMGGGLVRLIGAADPLYGIQKEIDVHLMPQGSRVTLVHRIRNTGDRPTTLAPWSLSVMAPGGVEIIPLPAKRPHPGDPKNAASAADFAPNQEIVLWPFSDLTDRRWHLGRHYIRLSQDAKLGATKLGLAHRQRWVGYLNGGTLFVKHFDYQDGKTYPDRGCNFETFTNEDMLEVESLGPLVELAPGESVEHTERWDLVDGVGAVSDEAAIDREVTSRIKLD